MSVQDIDIAIGLLDGAVFNPGVRTSPVALAGLKREIQKDGVLSHKRIAEIIEYVEDVERTR